MKSILIPWTARLRAARLTDGQTDRIAFSKQIARSKTQQISMKRSNKNPAAVAAGLRARALRPRPSTSFSKRRTSGTQGTCYPPGTTRGLYFTAMLLNSYTPDHRGNFLPVAWQADPTINKQQWRSAVQYDIIGTGICVFFVSFCSILLHHYCVSLCFIVLLCFCITL